MIAYLDCGSGISGDKFLAALIDAGFDLEVLQAALASIDLPDVEVSVAEVVSAGMRALRVSIEAPESQPHRTLADIQALISDAELPAPVTTSALETFRLLAEAEATVHHTSVDQVHFHEVGAIDSIVDVVGVALGVHTLGIERLVASPVAVGSGTVLCAHGELPVPAPATARLLEGVPIAGADLEGELTTPTGAALLRVHAADHGPMPPMTLRSTGCGAGTRELARPNVARVFLGEEWAETDEAREDIVLLESTIDHLSGEHLAYAAERLRQTAALDVWMRPVLAKKGRPAVVLSALARPADVATVADAFLAETGTLGVRIVPIARVVAPRREITLETSMGPVRFKISDARGAIAHVRAEAEDCMRLAAEHGMAVNEVAQMLAEEGERLLGV